MKQSEARPRRRWIVIGPGLVIAMILAVQVVIANRQKPSVPPIIERQVMGSAVTQTAKPVPEISYMLEREERLGLSEQQVKALGALNAKWMSEVKPLSAALKTAAGEFDAFMKESGGKANVRDIQSHTAPVSELSRQSSSLRRAYWEKAVQVLSASQRRTLENELSRGFHPTSAQVTGGTDQ